ncbi:hypothetical protein [Prosthecobacter sp.]|uniref:hypothetical protein n=1 Tax=Prosthecobacter sp. TaxID=1965333 RepID=UPI0037836EE4
MAPAFHLPVLCVLLFCCTGCGDRQNSGDANKDEISRRRDADQDQSEYPSETAVIDLGKAPLAPGAFKMSVGDYFKHLEEEHFAKKGLMLRIIVPPFALKDLDDVMKAPCESRVPPEDRARMATEGDLFNHIIAGIGQHPQYDRSTIYLRCFDDTYFPSYHINQSTTQSR